MDTNDLIARLDRIVANGKLMELHIENMINALDLKISRLQSELLDREQNRQLRRMNADLDVIEKNLGGKNGQD